MSLLPTVFGIPVDFLLFATTLLSVALFHEHTLVVALGGLATIALYKLVFTGFSEGPGFAGLGLHLLHEWVLIANLLMLLVGFALLARYFDRSRVPAVLPRVLPDDWKGGFVLLVMIFLISAFLDNIAAAIIGGTVAASVFRGRVHVGYLAAIVAASNAGGSGSVVGDTTTTMMWIDGISPLHVFPAYMAAATALLIFGTIAAVQQHRLQPIQAEPEPGVRIEGGCLAIVGFILAAAIGVNVFVNVNHPDLASRFPFIGLAVWLAILICTPLRRPDWHEVPGAARGAVFLLALVLCASMMPVEHLPAPGWQTALGLGFVSAVFDNIPLTSLALKQGGYDWGFLAYAVGFGGSMLWFGSSAGVALASQYPQARSAASWLRHGWHVAVAYVVGFFVMLAVLGWAPHAPHKPAPTSVSVLLPRVCCDAA